MPFGEKHVKTLRKRKEEAVFSPDGNRLIIFLGFGRLNGATQPYLTAWQVTKQDLTDIWRDLNPEEKRFTWRQNKPEVHCRLDFFLVSASIACRVSKADILPGYKTDHSLCTMEVN